MYNKIFFLLMICLAACSSGTFYDETGKYQSFSPDGISFTISETMWDVDNRGNHRAVVNVERQKHDAVIVHLPWRRPDMRPDTKRIVITDELTGREIKDIAILEVSSEKGTVAFKPETVPGRYHIYYLPYKYRTGWDDARYGKPWNDYLPPAYETDRNWEKAVVDNEDDIPAAVVECFQSRTKFDFFTSMGLIATQVEKDKLIMGVEDDFLLFPEDRAFPIKLSTIPSRWAKTGPSSSFEGNASLNEYYTWQTGIWAAGKDLKGLVVSFSGLVHKSGKARIEKDSITCFNLEGINWDGSPVKFDVDVPKDKVQALWFGVQIPENALPGTYRGQMKISAENSVSKTVDIKINVDKKIIAEKGDGELWRHSRLRWLNSAIGAGNLPVKPYGAMNLNENQIEATGKHVLIGQDGMAELVRINDVEVLSEPIEFIVETASGQISFETDNFTIQKEADGLVSWKSEGVSKEGIKLICNAYMEYDGYIHYNVELVSDKDIFVRDIKLVSHFRPESSEYFMGAGYKGGYCPAAHEWGWDGPFDSFWMGGYKSGLHTELRGGTYHGPLLNDYKPAPPETWFNKGKGRVTVKKNNNDAAIEASTGETTITSSPLSFEFAFLITPVKPVDTKKHFSQRYYHSDEDGFAKAAEEGANIINIHHSRKLNPVINYPFIVREPLIEYIKEQHDNSRKVKLYYTIRELSNYTEEIFALKSLKHEIFVSGVGYGIPWFCEHLVDDYKPAWYTQLPDQMSDAALVLNGFSRWINYYLEGLRWMLENYEIDGIYMDDVSFDRTVMKRMRKILEKYRPGSLIDLHSNTAYSIGPANQYAGFFPYVDRLWFGESFRYNRMKPDEWFVTFSGIPFGQMSEMLQDGGNRFLGMVYGATARHSYAEHSPAPVWKLWDDFEIQDSEMYGYWDENCPVHTSSPDVKATAYVKPGKALISLGNFGDRDTEVKLYFDWKKLGISPEKSILSAPEVKNFQNESLFSIGEYIPVKSKEGWLLILSEK